VNRRDALIALVLLAVYLLLAAGRLERPGLYDEEGTEAILAMEQLRGLPASPSDWGVSLGGRRLPLRGSSYSRMGFEIGAAAVGFSAGGVGVRSLRATGLILCALLLASFFTFCRLWMDLEPAAAATLMLATNPTFLIESRVAFMAHELFVDLFATMFLVGATLYRRRGSRPALFAGLFSLGFAVLVSIKALAFWAAFALVGVVFAPRRRLPHWKTVAGGALSFLLGASNVLLYEVSSGWPVSSLLWSNLLPSSAPRPEEYLVLGASAVNSSRPWLNLIVRLRQFKGLLETTLAAAPAGNVPTLRAFEMTLAVAVVFLLFQLRRGAGARRLNAAALATAALLFLSTCFSPSALAPQHLLVVWPALFFLVALALSQAKAIAAVWTRAATCALVLAQLWSFRGYRAALELSGGKYYWSDCTTKMAEDFRALGVRNPVYMTWGVGWNIYLLSEGAVRPRWGFAVRMPVDDELRARLVGYLREPQARFVFGAPELHPNFGLSYGYYDALEREARRLGRRLVLEKTYSDGLGTPVFLLYRHEAI
jgi:hypothetical protein